MSLGLLAAATVGVWLLLALLVIMLVGISRRVP